MNSVSLRGQNTWARVLILYIQRLYALHHYEFPVFTYAAAPDLLFLVAQLQNKGCYRQTAWSLHIVNLSKSKPKQIGSSDLYSALEGIKDGMFTSTKYTPQTILMNPCHIIVFSNDLPNTDCMTQGRFKILEWPQLPANLLNDTIEHDFACREWTVDEVKAFEAEELELQNNGWSMQIWVIS